MGDKLQSIFQVGDIETQKEVPADSTTLGEVFIRGNVVCLGYLKNREATEKAFKGDWFHSGDIAVSHKNGRLQIKDR